MFKKREYCQDVRKSLKLGSPNTFFILPPSKIFLTYCTFSTSSSAKTSFLSLFPTLGIANLCRNCLTGLQFKFYKKCLNHVYLQPHVLWWSWISFLHCIYNHFMESGFRYWEVSKLDLVINLFTGTLHLLKSEILDKCVDYEKVN